MGYIDKNSANNPEIEFFSEGDDSWDFLQNSSDDFDTKQEKTQNIVKTSQNKKEISQMNHFEQNSKTSVLYRKPDFNIVIDENESLIKIKLGYDEDLINMLKNKFKTIKYDSISKMNTLPCHLININKVQDFINDCYDVFGDIEKVFDFKFQHIKASLAPVKRFSLVEAVGDSVKELSKANKAKEGEFIAKKERSSYNDEDDQIVGGGKMSIYSQKETFKESIEEVAYDLMKDRVFISPINFSVYAYNSNYGCYTVSESKSIGIKDIISKTLEANNLSSYTKPRHLKSIEEHLQTQTYSNKRISYFNNKYVAVRMKNSQVLDKACLFIDYKEDGSRAFRVINSSEYIETNVFADVEIDAELIKDEEGNDWNGEDLDSGRYFYEFKTNRKSDIYKLFINDLFSSKNFEKITKMFIGSFLSGEKVQKALFLIGEGGDGKSVLMNMLMEIFKFSSTSFKLNNNGNRFQYSVLKDKKFAIISEMSQKNFDEMFFKNLTGGDQTFAESKGVDQFKLDIENLLLMVAMNYGDSFIIKEMDRAMKRRLMYVKCEPSKRVILNFARKILSGFFFEEEKREVESQRLEFFHWILEGSLEFVRENPFSDSQVNESYGVDVKEFYDNMIERMSPRGEFFNQYKIEVLTNGRGTCLADLYNYYENWANLEKTPALGLNNFKRELVKRADEEFKTLIDKVDFRANVGNALKRVLPITIKGAKIEQHALQYSSKLVKAGILTQEEYNAMVAPIDVVNSIEDAFESAENGIEDKQHKIEEEMAKLKADEELRESIRKEEEKLAEELESHNKWKKSKQVKAFGVMNNIMDSEIEAELYAEENDSE